VTEEFEPQRALMLANLLDTMRTFAGVRSGAQVWEDDGILCIYSGFPGAVFNSVLLTKPVHTEEELKLKFDYVDAMYRQRRARWSLWLADYLVPGKILLWLKPILDRYGATVVSRGSGLFAEKLLPARKTLPTLEFLPVGIPATRFDFCHVMSAAFRTPLATFLDVYHNTEYWSGEIRGFLAYSGNRAVATTCIMPSRGVLGVYGVAVLPDVQRKGIGERIVRHALEEMSGKTGLTSAVLQSSEIAENLYRRMGFRRITSVTIYNEAR